MTTIFPKKGELKPTWYLIDVKGKVLGRAAARVAYYLHGKERLNFTPNCDMQNFIVVINAKDIIIKGSKFENKFYAKHTNYPSGLKIKSLRQVFEKDPAKVFKTAVQGMLPKNVLGKNLLRKLHVYSESKHEHEAQQPIPLEI